MFNTIFTQLQNIGGEIWSNQNQLIQIGVLVPFLKSFRVWWQFVFGYLLIVVRKKKTIPSENNNEPFELQMVVEVLQ